VRRGFQRVTSKNRSSLAVRRRGAKPSPNRKLPGKRAICTLTWPNRHDSRESCTLIGESDIATGFSAAGDSSRGCKVKKRTLANITQLAGRQDFSAAPAVARRVERSEAAQRKARTRARRRLHLRTGAEPELVTGKDRRDEQVLGAPAGRVAAETRIGRSQNVGLARCADRMRALIAPIIRSAAAGVSGRPSVPLLAPRYWLTTFGSPISPRRCRGPPSFSDSRSISYLRSAPLAPLNRARGYTAVRRCDGIRWTIPKTVMCRSSISWTMLTWRRLQGRSASGGEAAWDARCASRVTFAERNALQ
jgi:hypothetical protein